MLMSSTKIIQFHNVVNDSRNHQTFVVLNLFKKHKYILWIFYYIVTPETPQLVESEVETLPHKRQNSIFPA